VTDRNGEWKPFPGAKDYEASHRGKVRSLDRDKNGRFYKGVVLKLREDGDGYLVFNYTDDGGVRHTNASVARLVLLAHDPGGHAAGMQACHGPGGQKDNRWPENLRWDTPDANREEALAVRLERNPPKPPKPPKVCPRCQREHRDKGRNCHGCVVQLGVQAARLRAAGVTFREAGDRLGYPPDGLDVLAERYGGLRFSIDSAAVAQGKPAAVTQRNRKPLARQLRRVINRARVSARNSDAR
jgi:hypothetical protein